MQLKQMSLGGAMPMLLKQSLTPASRPKKHCLRGCTGIVQCCKTASWLRTTLLVRGPEGEVVAQQLHDQGRVLVRILSNVVQLGNGIFERCPGHLACLFWVAQDFVLEHRVVQGETKTDRMRHCQASASH